MKLFHVLTSNSPNSVQRLHEWDADLLRMGPGHGVICRAGWFPAAQPA